MGKVPIRVMTKDFVKVGEVDGYTSLSFTRSWHGVGVLRMVINRHIDNAEELQVGRIVFPSNRLDTCFVIENRTIKVDEGGKESEDYEIEGYELKFVATNRITLPPRCV